MDLPEISRKNSEFWDSLCGTNAAIALGITDRSSASLRKFDEWFFHFYPYLSRHIPYSEMQGKEVLEVGLGYGSVGQKIAQAGADYTGLDIAPGPVEMMKYRLSLQELDGQAIVGSILDAPFSNESFDYIVAIGCYHHTGNLPKAIDESRRLLRPGGHLIFMVYNGLSYRHWHSDWKATLRHLLTWHSQTASDAMCVRYDCANGQSAPHTDFVCRSALRYHCRSFRHFKSTLENIANEPPFKKPREHLLTTLWPRLVGLDIYATAIK
jgi:SAM-dependent methyltransferase